MISPETKTAFIQTVDEMTEMPVESPVYRCPWCQPHSYFMRRLDGHTMRVDRPQFQSSFSDGICNNCDAKVRAKANLPARERSPLEGRHSL